MSVKSEILGNGKQSFVDAIFQGTCQKVAFSTSSAQSAAFGSATSMVRVIATKACHINFGADPTAAAAGSTSIYLAPSVAEHFLVTPAHKVAVIRDAEDGNLFITEAASL